MYNGKAILSIVPARGNSKGLPRKNIKPILGKPLIAWTIEQSLASRYLDKVIVSTDDPEIAKISQRYGATVPFRRPPKLAADKTPMIEVILHTLNWLKEHRLSSNLIMLLQPTSPLRTFKDIDRSIELLFAKKAKAVVSVCPIEYHPYWSNILPKNGCMSNFLNPKIVNKNRQELPVFYRLNGAIFLADCDYLIRHRNFFGKDTYAYIMPTERSVDIDTRYDFKIAEYLIKRSYAKGGLL